MLQSGRSLVRSQLVSVEFFIDIKSFRSHYGPGFDLASNRNEYQDYFLGVKSARCVRLTTYHHPAPLSRNLGTLTSWNSLGLSRLVMGLLYLPPRFLQSRYCGFLSHWGRANLEAAHSPLPLILPRSHSNFHFSICYLSTNLGLPVPFRTHTPKSCYNFSRLRYLFLKIYPLKSETNSSVGTFHWLRTL